MRETKTRTRRTEVLVRRIQACLRQEVPDSLLNAVPLLADRKADQRTLHHRPVFLGAEEHAQRHTPHLLVLHEPLCVLQVRHARVGNVSHKEVPALCVADLRASLLQRARQKLVVLLERGSNPAEREVVPRQSVPQPGRHALLQRHGAAVRSKPVHGAHGADKVGSTADPPNPPARQGHRLPGAGHCERPVSHAVHVGNAQVLRAGEGHGLVDLVADADDVVLLAEPRNELELRLRQAVPGRVVRRVHHNHLRLAGEGPFQVLLENSELRCLQLDDDGLAASETCARKVPRKERFKHDNFVALVQETHHGGVQPEGRRRDGADLSLRVQPLRVLVHSLVRVRDRFVQLGQPGNGRILVQRRCVETLDRARNGARDKLRGLEVREALAQVDDTRTAVQSHDLGPHRAHASALGHNPLRPSGGAHCSLVCGSLARTQ
eukprot:Rhum_TRINITY_DN181_c0_g2::Rhum_TRINITY_DN181_c0_g2_i1::g.531::m.531